MLQIAPNAPRGTVSVRHNEPTRQQRAELHRRNLLSSLATPKAGPVPIRTLPWPQFLAKLEHRRDIVVRAHIRWAMRAAIRHCETLRRAEGRVFDLRPGGRHNIVANGGLYYENYKDDYRGVPTRIAPGDDAKLILENGRYVYELEDNLRRLLVPEWFIPTAKRYIRAKLALGWDLDSGEGT